MVVDIIHDVVGYRNAVAYLHRHNVRALAINGNEHSAQVRTHVQLPVFFLGVVFPLHFQDDIIQIVPDRLRHRKQVGEVRRPLDKGRNDLGIFYLILEKVRLNTDHVAFIRVFQHFQVMFLQRVQHKYPAAAGLVGFAAYAVADTAIGDEQHLVDIFVVVSQLEVGRVVSVFNPDVFHNSVLLA